LESLLADLALQRRDLLTQRFFRAHAWLSRLRKNPLGLTP
jgi:hypothetical protein